jgi:hypothetical protein
MAVSFYSQVNSFSIPMALAKTTAMAVGVAGLLKKGDS